MIPPIPHLVYSTRSISPQSGSDFIREIVAESAGINDDVRAEFARRAGSAGSALQHQLRHPIYMFSPVGPDRWLLCRAVSLGLYLKWSNQLLVHGVILAEEHLAALDGNPLLLDLPEIRGESGLCFLERHPGNDRRLPVLTFDVGVAARCRELNREHLQEFGERIGDNWLAAAYDGLAQGGRVGFIARDPAPSLAEGVLLHFHLDDRLELSFHTFYSHARPLDYRLLVLAPEDAAAVREHFGDLHLLDLGGLPPDVAPGSLGGHAVRLRRASLNGFLHAVQVHRLTYWSRGCLPPLADEDAILCLRGGLGEALTPSERRRFQELKARGESALRYRVTSLTHTWREKPLEFRQQLAETADTNNRVALTEVSDLLEEPPAAWDERWCLLALLLHAGDLRRSEDWRSERQRAWQVLMPAEEFAQRLFELSDEQASQAEPLLLEYALSSLEPADDTPAPLPYWETLVRWLGRRCRLKELLAPIEEALAGLVGKPAEAAWVHLQLLLSEADLPGEALRIFFSRHRPLLRAADAGEATEQALRWWLEHGGDYDSAIAPLLSLHDLTDQSLRLLGNWFSEQPRGKEENAFRRLAVILDGMQLPLSAAPACGALLASLALSGMSNQLPAIMGQCLRAIREQEEGSDDGFAGAALTEASESVLMQLDRSRSISDLPYHLRAVASLLEARNYHRATLAADAVLMRLAVRGRILAQEARAHRVAEDEVTAFDRGWTVFLRCARVMEYLQALEIGNSPDDLDRVQEWLELLQDEIAARPGLFAEDDPRLRMFVSLAWWWWRAGQGRPGLSAVCAKLRLAQTWGRIPASREWQRQRMEELISGPLLERAVAILPPRPESRRFAWLGRLGEKR